MCVACGVGTRPVPTKPCGEGFLRSPGGSICLQGGTSAQQVYVVDIGRERFVYSAPSKTCCTVIVFFWHSEGYPNGPSTPSLESQESFMLSWSMQMISLHYGTHLHAIARTLGSVSSSSFPSMSAYFQWKAPTTLRFKEARPGGVPTVSEPVDISAVLPCGILPGVSKAAIYLIENQLDPRGSRV